MTATGPHLTQLGTATAVPFADRPDLVVGRSRDAGLPVHDLACSRRQFRVRRNASGFVLEPLSDNSPTFCDGARVTGPTAVGPGALIEAGASRFRVVAAADPAPATRETVRHVGPIDDPAPDLVAVRLGDADVILGRDPGAATATLAHPLVSRRHSLVRRHAGGAVVKDLGRVNGTFVNGKRLRVAVRIDPGDRVQVGPFALTFTGDALVPAGSARAAGHEPPGRLVAHQLRVVGRDGRPLLDDVTLSFRAGEVVAVIGPTGCGKSPLLTALSGAAPPAGGRQADREMMGLFRHLATAGKTVVAVTHTLAHVPEFCHRVVVLAPGGRLAFAGRPAEALEYFRIDRLDDVYERLGERDPAAWAERFAAFPRVPRVPPPPPGPAAEPPAPADTPAAVGHQAPVVAARTARTLLADPWAVALAAFQPVLVAALVVWAFGDVRVAGHPPATTAAARTVLFVLAVTAFWLGRDAAAREWPLHRKERQVNLSPAAYLLAKWAVLAGLTVAQVVVLYLLVVLGCGLPGEARPALVLLAAGGAAGVSAGLLASAAAGTEAFAVTLVPVLVIPQLVLTDAFRPLAGGVRAFADVAVSAHRGFGGCWPRSPRNWPPSSPRQA